MSPGISLPKTLAVLFLATGTAMLSAWLCRRFIDPGSRLHVLDHPDHRSLHQRPVPRSGGVAILLSLLLAWWVAVAGNAVQSSVVLLWMSGGILVLGSLGVWDDLRDLSPALRLPVQTLVALSLVPLGLSLGSLELPCCKWRLSGPLGAFLAVFFMLWMINLYNFMDGMDGFAGGMALIGFSALAGLGYLAGDTGYSLLALLVASASAGFLVYNFPPARIFMGDAGAPVLGFLAAAFMLWADRQGLFPLWIGLLVFAPFVVDATYTLVRRLLRGEAVWKPHRGHLYQKLVLAGWSHRRTVLWSYLLMLAGASSALIAQQVPQVWQTVLMFGWMLLYLLLILLVERTTGAVR